MKILFITSAHNGLSQRAELELKRRDYEINIHIAHNLPNKDALMQSAIDDFKPDLIVAPILKVAIPESIWSKNICFIVHPGIIGDRGPSSLDWAILNQKKEWGVTILQAAKEMDAGDIWASKNFKMRDISKSKLYRHEVTQAAIEGLVEAVENFEKNLTNKNSFIPRVLDYSDPNVKGCWIDPIKKSQRMINWGKDDTDLIIRKIKAADSSPGVPDNILGKEFRLFGAHREDFFKGAPKEILATRNDAICLGTIDGALWITHLKSKNFIKLPAKMSLKREGINLPHNITESKISPFDNFGDRKTFREIIYTEKDSIGYIEFNFYNGAMSTKQCQRLRTALFKAKQRDTKILVLMGGVDIWSNGIHLNVIENSKDPVEESWENINAINDLIRDIVITRDKIVVSAMHGNAGAGGAILALASDIVYAREGIILNPHYKKMGLHGSEYWTKLLPERVGESIANKLMDHCETLSTFEAKEIGFLDSFFGKSNKEFREKLEEKLEKLKTEINIELLKDKEQRINNFTNGKCMEDYRHEELSEMWKNFQSSEYNNARHRFVHKIACHCTIPMR